jgi:hypothetical protein
MRGDTINMSAEKSTKNLTFGNEKLTVFLRLFNGVKLFGDFDYAQSP